MNYGYGFTDIITSVILFILSDYFLRYESNKSGGIVLYSNGILLSRLHI